MSWIAIRSNLTIVSNALLSIIRVIWIPINFLLSLTINIILFITLPLQYFYRLNLYLISISISFLALFETIYYYFSAALLLGLLSGTGLYYTTLFLYRLLSIDSSASSFVSSASSSASSTPPSPANSGIAPKKESQPIDKKGRTAASYRAERAARQAEIAKEQLLVRQPLTKISLVGSGSGNGNGIPAGWSAGSTSLNRFPLSPVGERKQIPSLLGTTIFEEEDDSSGEDWRTM